MKTEFKKGDYIVVLKLGSVTTACAKENYCFKQREDDECLSPICDLYGDRSNANATLTFDKSDRLLDWRYATDEEIAKYNEIGKPYDVTTLNKTTMATPEELLEKAKRDYPIGTMYIGLRDNEPYTARKNPNWVPKGCNEYFGIEVGPDYVYKDGKWAKIVTNDIPEYVECVHGFSWGGSIMEGVIFDTKVNMPGTKRTWESRLKDYPKDFRPSTKEAFEKQNSKQMPEYVECIYSDAGRFIVGRIYSGWPDLIDERGLITSDLPLDGNIWKFKPSTKEAFEKQNNKQMPEYVECVDSKGWGSTLKEGVIYDTKVDIPGAKSTWVSRLKNHPVDFRPSTKEAFEKQNNFSIKAGDYLYCHTDLVTEDDNSFIAATKGKVYKSEVDGCFTNNNSEKRHYITLASKWFRKATQEEINKVMSKQKLTVPVTDVLKIHSIACAAWKNKIASDYLPRVNAKQEIKFTQSEIDSMFKAATDSQLPVLEEVFGKQSKPIDWDKIKTGSQVMIKYSGDHCGGINDIDTSKPVTVIFFNVPYMIRDNGDFLHKGLHPKYCTFNQGGKFVFFTSENETYKNYIVEVVQY